MEPEMIRKLKELEERIDGLESPQKEIMKIEEVTEVFGWSRRKIFQMRNEGVIRFYRFPNTRRRYLKRSEIEQLFEVDKLEAA